MVNRLNTFSPILKFPATSWPKTSLLSTVIPSIVLLSIALVVFPQQASGQELEGKTVRVVIDGSTEAKFAAVAQNTFWLRGWTTSIEVQPTEQLRECIKLRKKGKGCLSRLLTGIDYVATFRISADEQTGLAVVIASLLHIEDGQSVVIPVQIHCHCKLDQTDKLATVIKKASETIISELQSEKSPSYVIIRCEPSDAVLSVDGIRIGSGKSKVAPGQVTVLAKREGYKSKRLTVPLSPGEELDLPIELEPIKHSPLYWTGGIALTVVGAGTIGAGFLLVDGTSSVAGGQRDSTSSRVAQVATISAGFAMVGLGLTAMALDHQRVTTERRESRSLAIMPAPNGFSVAVLGNF